ncbi:MAG TPA: PilZ domain-containing protein [Myxococcota bacterium]|nr:PilZ domain-containing protein [Myxococcota bacterium]
MSGRARRRYRRMTVRIRAAYEHAGTTREATATTLGAGGLFVASDDPPPTGSILRIRFRVPGGSREHAVTARVVWAHRPGDPGAQSPGMGLSFTSPADVAGVAAELEASADLEEKISESGR